MTIVLGTVLSTTANGGTPFLTDDPVPVEYGHSEFYVFSTYDKAPNARDTVAPGFEFNYGIAPETQFHVLAPLHRVSPGNAPSEYGVGDIELGVKYRFIKETEHIPQVGISPMLELPLGNPDKGLGNGKPWWRLPLWIQKSWGEWTTYGGAGYVINHATGAKNYPFCGWLLQDEVSERLTLGGEVFARQKVTGDGNSTTILNFGGLYKFTPGFNLLFSAGHSVGGETHAVGYLGLYWTWGGEEKEQKAAGTRSDQDNWSMARRP